jgi:polyphosphate kinase
MTVNPEITDELCHVFQVLERHIIVPKTKHLLVSPFTSRNKFSELIKNEIKNAQNGYEAYIILKLNSLQDTKMIDLLYEASNAGVTIKLLIRGICCLVPGIKDQSENIHITSIVDRFLEHGRVYLFANGGKEKMYIGSADWMTRNLDHRIEVITPILDKDIHITIRKLLDLQLNDDVKARLIDVNQNNNYINPNKQKESSQHLIYKTLL